jgi:hypothetical protein
VLAEVREEVGARSTTGVPFLVSQFFGSGRVFYVGSGELWRLRRNDERLYERLTTQIVREVSEGRLLRGSRRGGFLVDQRELALGEDLSLRAFVLDEKFEPLRAAKLIASATTTQGVVDVPLEPVVGQPGRFQGLLASPPAGVVKVQLPLPGGGHLDESFTIRASRLETDDVRVRRDVLERLATATGGSVVTTDQIGELSDRLPQQAETTTVASPPHPLWDRPWVVCIFVALLATEWALRRWKRLA